MMLRPRQSLLVERTLSALDEHGNTLAVAPTGSGKTIMLSAVTGSYLVEPDAKACILAHRTELTGQNRAKLERVNPGMPRLRWSRPCRVCHILSRCQRWICS